MTTYKADEYVEWPKSGEKIEVKTILTCNHYGLAAMRKEPMLGCRQRCEVCKQDRFVVYAETIQMRITEMP